MIVLKPTTDSLELVTENASSIDYNISWVDHTSTGVTPGRSAGKVSSVTTSSLVAAPGSGVTRQIRGVSLLNTTSGSASTIKVQVDNSSTETVMTRVNLQPGDSLNYSDGPGWYTTDATGKHREQQLDSIENPGVGYMSPFYKVGGGAVAAGVLHCQSLTSGMPGAWSPGTPGLGGRIVDGLTAADSGSIYVRPSGSFPYAYLRGFTASSTQNAGVFLCDFLWVNSGIVLTTTTAQNIVSVDWPPRDLFGYTSGDGVEIGLLVTTTMANGTITNTTMNYTGSDGRDNLTATITSFTTNSTAGTLFPFQLAAGSTGVKKVQSVTLGTSYGATGAMSLVAFRRLALVSNPFNNVADHAPITDDGVRLWPGTSLHLVQLTTTTTATTIQGNVFIVEK